MKGHIQMPWHSKSTKQVLENLDSSEIGLSSAEAGIRLLEYGSNELVQKEKKSIFEMLFDQIKDPMVLILIVAVNLSLILGEIVESIVILVIVILNATIGILQERKAQSSLEALKNMSAPTAIVLRDNEETLINTSDLVVGDIVFLEDGSIVPADIRLIQSYNLQSQESSLTGESLPVTKDHDVILEEECSIGDRVNMVYSSSIITYGRGVGVVVATGMDTQVGQIANLIESQDEYDTPLKKKLNYIGKVLSLIGIAVCILVFAIGLYNDKPLIPLLMTAISLAISIIPEGLPATATIIMAFSVQRMAKKNALITKLPAVETLGSATVICSDKTGTLTLNKMRVEKMFNGDDILKGKIANVSHISEEHNEYSNPYEELIYGGILCNNACIDSDKDKVLGDPTEAALLYLGKGMGIDIDKFEEKRPRLYEQPFDSDRKRMTTVNLVDNKNIVYTKGAVEGLLPICTHILTSEGIKLLDDLMKENIENLYMEMCEEGLRVLGFAKKEVDEYDDMNLENNLIFIGCVGMIDPPRVEVSDSIDLCKSANIRTVMITGDNKITAMSIAKKLGIYSKGDSIISGEELNSISDLELDKMVKNTSVFARVSPKDKLRIVESLKRNGEVAAMTGDGVNDSPALKSADIGIAMGITGTDIAKESSDMILVDDNFSTIISAVKEGRRVYNNIQMVIQFLLVGNIAEILTLFMANLLNWPTPLLALHVLWVNLATATLPALALGVNPADENIMKERPMKSGKLFEKETIFNIISQGIGVFMVTIVTFFIGLNYWNQTTGQTMAFCVLAFSQMLRAFSYQCNSSLVFSKNRTRNKYVGISIVVSALLMIAVLYIPVFRGLFSLESLDFIKWVIILGLSSITLLHCEFSKFIKRNMISTEKESSLPKSA